MKKEKRKEKFVAQLNEWASVWYDPGRFEEDKAFEAVYEALYEAHYNKIADERVTTTGPGFVMSLFFVEVYDEDGDIVIVAPVIYHKYRMQNYTALTYQIPQEIYDLIAAGGWIVGLQEADEE